MRWRREIYSFHDDEIYALAGSNVSFNWETGIEIELLENADLSEPNLFGLITEETRIEGRNIEVNEDLQL